jgi:RNA polymerase sigma-70 factor (ECF subfamily)
VAGISVAETDRVKRFEEQILVHLDDLYRAALRFTGQAADAEDLVQETCIRAFRSLDQLRVPAAAKVWVFTILRSVFLRQIDQRPSRPQVLSLDDVEDSVLASSGALGALYGEGLPIEYAQRNEIRDAILKLPLPYREA